ncbi:MAG: hypothetical protein Q8R44_16435 [Novosphingobium sp.]|nr:hypothetical protein [Novosphingobium sp.]
MKQPGKNLKQQDERAEPRMPVGIGREHLAPSGPRWLRPLLLWVAIGVPIALALTGALGGGQPGRWVVQRESSDRTSRILVVETPWVIRSGNWFETRVEIVPPADVADLVVAIDDPLWRRMSIDTVLPDAEKAEYREGAFRLSFGPAKAGELRVVKFDGQIQPWGPRRLKGHYRVLDGDAAFADVAVSVTVMP